MKIATRKSQAVSGMAPETPQLGPCVSTLFSSEAEEARSFRTGISGVWARDTRSRSMASSPTDQSVAKPSKEEAGVGNDHVRVIVKLIGHRDELVRTAGHNRPITLGSHLPHTPPNSRFEWSPEPSRAGKPSAGGGAKRPRRWTCGQGPKRSFDVAKFKLPPEQPRSFGFGWLTANAQL